MSQYFHPKTLIEIAMVLSTNSGSFPSNSHVSATFSILLRFGESWILIRWPINRFNRFCDFLRFNRFNRFIEIIKSIFSKFWKLTNFRFLKKISVFRIFLLRTQFCEPLTGNHSLETAGIELSSQRLDDAWTNHKTTLSDPAPSDRLYTQPSFSWIYWAFFLMGPLSITCGTTNHSKRDDWILRE